MTAEYERIYAMFPALPDEERRDWAEKVLHSPVLLYAYSGSTYPYPFEPADYTEDPK